MLRDFQSLLSTVYEIDHRLDVYDFLVTDPALLSQWEETATPRSTEEKLLIQEHENELAMLLFLDSELLERLFNEDPRDYLGRRNLADFCTVLEGISHFNYVAWNASADKSVTLMELEMQAEVDKYICARAILHQQQVENGLSESLLKHLFENPAFDTDLSAEERMRYRDASTLAGRYCRSLEKRFSDERLDPEMMDDLRIFYRLPQPDKVSHIQSVSFL
jgi:hypothetical protein